MALTYVQYVGNGSTSQFSIPFPFLQQTHVKVKLNGVILNTPLEYSWVNNSTLDLEITPTSLETVEIYRETPYTAGLVEFQNGANLTEAALNTAVRQLLYVFQEYNERIREALDGAALNVATDGALVPTEGNDIFDDMVTHILDTNLSDTLQQRLADIDNNAQSIIDLAVSFTDVQAQVDGIDENGPPALQASILALQTALTDLQAITATLGTDILTEQTSRVDGDNALSTSLTAISAVANANTAALLVEQTARVDGDAAEATARTALGVTVSDNTAALVTEQTARSDGDTALTVALTAQGVSVADNAAAIATEQTARADGDTALATSVSGVAATAAATAAALTTEETARADGDAALSSSIATVSATASGNTAAILTEQTARADGDSALTTSINAVISDVADNAAAVVTEQTARASGDTANADAITALGVTVSSNTSGITAEQTARANGDASLASDITTVTASVAGNAAAITTEATARASADSNLGTDIASLEARYGVKLNVNGYVTGFAQNNDGTTGSFKILADEFKIIDPAGSSGQAGIQVFETSGGYATMKNVRSAPTGERIQWDGDVLKVFDASNVLRVKLGNLA